MQTCVSIFRKKKKNILFSLETSRGEKNERKMGVPSTSVDWFVKYLFRFASSVIWFFASGRFRTFLFFASLHRSKSYYAIFQFFPFVDYCCFTWGDFYPHGEWFVICIGAFNSLAGPFYVICVFEWDDSINNLAFISFEHWRLHSCVYSVACSLEIEVRIFTTHSQANDIY